MNPTKLSKSVLQKITDKKVSQRPRWHFIAKNTAFWGIFICAAILGAIGFAIILTTLFTLGIEAVADMPKSPLNFLISIFPVFWAVLFGVFLTASIWGFQHTRKGYKIPLVYLIIGNIGLSLILGTGLFVSRDGERVEQKFARYVSMYESIEHRKQRLWRNPNHGRISGEIIEITSDKNWKIKDNQDQVWTLDLSQVRRIVVENPQIGDQIKTAGEKVSDQTFKSMHVAPWDWKPPFKRREGRRKRGQRPPRRQFQQR